MNQGSSFLGGSFSNINNVQQPQSNLEENVNPSILKYYSSTRTEQLCLFSTEINKWFPAPFHTVSQLRFKLKSQFQLLPQIRCLITSRVESRIISIDDNMQITSGRSLINSRKRVGPKIVPERTPALTGYSCEYFLSWTTRSCPLPGKEEIRPRTLP